MSRISLFVVGSMLGTFVGAASARADDPLTADFDLSSEGWTVETRTNPTGAFTVVGTFAPDFVASGGDLGGHLREVDPDSNWSFFAAPSAWHGNRGAFLGTRLSYSIRTNLNEYPDGRLVVLFGGGLRISCATELPPVGVWTRRTILLDEGPWRVGSSGTGAVATRAQIQTVLGSLTRVLIGLEYGSELGEEQVDLDRVVFGEPVPCPADFNGDGFLDFFDYDDFVRCFETGECPPGRTADFNGDNFVDFFDYDAFVEGFERGC